MKTKLLLLAALLIACLFTIGAAQGIGECAWPGCDETVTGDLTVNGALVIVPNDVLNVSKLAMNEEGGSNKTCAVDGTVDEFTTMDSNDADNTNAVIQCDGTTRLGQVGRMDWIKFQWLLVPAGLLDAFICPINAPRPADLGYITYRGSATANGMAQHCYPPDGLTTRFHSISFVASTGTTDSDEECMVQIECTAAMSDGVMTSSKIIDAAGGGDATLVVGGFSVGNGDTQALDPTDGCATWWSLRILDDGGGGTCSEMGNGGAAGVAFSILVEYSDL